jgi:hypothetical protein
VRTQSISGDALANVLSNETFDTTLWLIRNHEKVFATFLDDGTVPIDNHDTEELIKQVATGRKTVES